MTTISSKLLRFENVDLEKYINERLPKYENSIIQTERHNLTNLRKEIDTEIFKSFILNADSLLEMLFTYKDVHNMLKEMKDIAVDYKKLGFNVESSEKISFVNKGKVEKFRSIIENFSTDIQSFDTGERYLEYFDFFSSLDDETHIFILTNDILLIGKRESQTNKYQLVNAFSYNIIEVNINDNILFVLVSQTSMKFRGEAKKLKKFMNVYKELIYESTEKKHTEENDNDLKEDVLEFLIYTEQYDKISESLDKSEDKTSLKNFNKFLYSKNDLFTFVKMLDESNLDTSGYLFWFLENKLEDNLSNIDKVKCLKDLINSVFNYFYKFYVEQDILLRESEKITKINKLKTILLIENELLLCLRILESRMFNKRYDTKVIDSYLCEIEKKLNFFGNDFSYLIDFFENRRKEHMKYSLDKAKSEISKIINDIVK